MNKEDLLYGITNEDLKKSNIMDEIKKLGFYMLNKKVFYTENGNIYFSKIKNIKFEKCSDGFFVLYKINGEYKTYDNFTIL